MGHIQAACLKKRKEQQPLRTISKHSIQTVKVIDTIPQVRQPIQIKGQDFTFEVDTGAGDNFCSVEVWTKIGKPTLAPASCRYEVANGQPLATLGTFHTVVLMQGEKPRSSKIQFTVSKTPRLNLLGRDAIVKLGVDILAVLGIPSADKQFNDEAVLSISYLVLQQACEQLCREFPDLFKPELGCLKDFQLEVKFKPEAKPVFCKPRVVPFALLEDMMRALLKEYGSQSNSIHTGLQLFPFGNRALLIRPRPKFVCVETTQCQSTHSWNHIATQCTYQRISCAS